MIGYRYDTGKPVRITIRQGRIAAIDGVSDDEARGADWLAPGLVDLQVNGYGGQEFNDLALTVDDVARICELVAADGVAAFCPTVTTHSAEMITHAIRTIATACQQSPEVAKRVAGIHVEGPYLSPEDGPRGAHPVEHCRPPDWDEFQRFQEAAEGRIRILTLSPEYEGSPAFIERVAAHGVLVAIGHTAATSEQIAAAASAGARMSTHLGNGAHGQIRRHPNYIWDQLADDRLVASLIVDGHHLPASVVQSFVRAKGVQRVVLVSDITGLGGMPPGRYENASLGAVEVLDDGRLVVAGQRQYLAGAALPLRVGVANVMRMAGVSLKDAIDMASRRPAELLGLDHGRLEVGAPGDLFVVVRSANKRE